MASSLIQHEEDHQSWLDEINVHSWLFHHLFLRLGPSRALLPGCWSELSPTLKLINFKGERIKSNLEFLCVINLEFVLIS